MGEVVRIPVTRCRFRDAEIAYEAHKALLLVQRDYPAVAALPSFSRLREEAWQRFSTCFERL